MVSITQLWEVLSLPSQLQILHWCYAALSSLMILRPKTTAGLQASLCVQPLEAVGSQVQIYLWFTRLCIAHQVNTNVEETVACKFAREGDDKYCMAFKQDSDSLIICWKKGKQLFSSILKVLSCLANSESSCMHSLMKTHHQGFKKLVRTCKLWTNLYLTYKPMNCLVYHEYQVHCAANGLS